MSLYELTTNNEPGTAPGSINPDDESPPPAIHVFGYGPEVLEEFEVSQVSELEGINERFDVVWLDVQGLGDAEYVQSLGGFCEIHPLALEDAVNVGQRAKLEEYGDDAMFFVLWMLSLDDELITREQLGIFTRPGLVVTFQEHPGDCLDPVRRRLREGRQRLRTTGSDYLLYSIIDTVVDHYVPVLEELSDIVEQIEDDIVERKSVDEAQRIHQVKRSLLSMRRLVWPLCDALNRAAQTDIPLIAEATRPYFRDCHDHALRVLDVTEAYRELATGLMDLHLSTMSNRMNEVMKVLTIIATIFIPMTFISSLYGMNFDDSNAPLNMPELRWKYGYLAAILAMLTFAGVLLLWFRRKGWIGNSENRT